MNLKIPATKIVFDIPTKCSNVYLRSPLYKGSKIWNTLPEDILRVATIGQFVKRIKPRYSVFENLLGM